MITVMYAVGQQRRCVRWHPAYNPRMDTLAQMLEEMSEDARVHVRNVAENLQLAADLGYGVSRCSCQDPMATWW